MRVHPARRAVRGATLNRESGRFNLPTMEADGDWLDARDFAPSAFFANNKGHFPLLVEMDGIFVNRALVRD